MRDANGWRGTVTTVVAILVTTAVGSGLAGGTPLPHSHRNPVAFHDHSHHFPVGGPPALRSAATARYFGSTSPYDGPTKGIRCDKGSRPEDVQGKVPKADYDSGRAAKGYFCNARLVSHFGSSGGYRVE